MGTSVISVKNLRHSYREGDGVKEVLHGINLEFGEGEIVIIMGPSGSGKSTLLKLIGAQLTLQSGDVVICGKILSQRLTKSGSHKLTKLLFQSGTCLLQLFIRNSTALRPRQNRRRALPLFYNKFPKVTTRICKFFRFLFRLFSIPFIEKICNKICRKISKILLQNL